MLKNLIRQPLLHFLLIGLGLFVLYNLTVKDIPEETYSKTIVVDKDALLTFMQYRSKAFDEKGFSEKLESMNEEELSNLIDDYVREEVLYREALGIGLDREDYVIRRRLVQKVEFINRGFIDSTTELSGDEIKKYFEENRDDYFVEPSVTFTHVYFGNDVHGKEKARVLAEQKLASLNENQVPFTKGGEHGDRFLYHLNYVERTPEYVSSHMGDEFTDEIFSLTPSDAIWYGPFESKYGSHLVMLSGKKDGRYPEIEEIYGRVKDDARFSIIREKSNKTIGEIIDAYDVRIVYEGPEEAEIPAQDSQTRSDSGEN